MHELALTRSVLEIALEKGSEVRATRISKIALEVGKLSGAVPHSIEFCFEVLARGTIAEQASLVFVEPHGNATCKQCEHEFDVENYYGVCPNCRCDDIAISGGDSLYVKSIEIERS